MVKVNYGSLQTQSSSLSSASQSRVAGFRSLISAFESFGGSAGELLGSGYDSARAYATGVMVPYYQGCILYSEAVADAANSLADSYAARCGAEIDSASRGCMALSASISGLQSKSKPAKGDAARIASLQSQLDAANARVQEAQQKLDNLLAFSAESPSACAAADAYQGAVSQARGGISASFGGGGFALPENLTWISAVNEGWADREIALENNYLSALEKVYNGEALTEAELTAIERYAAEYPDRVDASVLQHVQQARQVKAEEMKVRSLIDKVDDGKVLTDEEVKTLQEYEQKYPEGDLKDHIQGALGENEKQKQRIEKKDSSSSKLSKKEEDLLTQTISSFKNGEIDLTGVGAVLRLLKENGVDLNNETILNFVKEFGFESATSFLQDKASDISADHIISVALPHAPMLLQQLKNYIGTTVTKLGTTALLSTSSGSAVNQLVGKGIDAISNFAVPVANSLDDLGRMDNALASNAQFAKYLPYGVGAALDFGLQLYQGKPVGEAAIKTAGHTAIAAGLLLAGATGPVGFVLGVGGSMLFDAIYDNREAIGKWAGDAVSSVSDKAGEIFDKAGDAVGGFFSGLGSAFG
ncbi:hypothetical protein ACVRXQ_13035 [Streptococcus panodentis]|uniref:hypothetical protein n=1 Tax=Streptococcus panodentis TaxID=1581472 RepID=UPI001FDABEA1|nr:hypothetical protein [Streptococcus panodentis]